MPQSLPPGFEIEQHGPGADPEAVAATATPAPSPAATPALSADPSMGGIPEGFAPELPPSKPEPKAPEPLSMDEFESQLYTKLNDPKGGNLDDIVKWSNTTGHRLLPGKPLDEAWNTAQNNRAKPDDRGVYGRVTQKDNSLDAEGVGALLRGAAAPLTLNFGDEISAGGKALLGYGEGKTLADRYNSNWLANNVQDNVDEVVNAGPRRAGQVAGTALSAMIPLGAFKQGASLPVNMLRGGAVGTVEGGIAGTGSGAPGNRFEYTAPGAETGFAAGVAAPVVAKALGAVARPIIDAVTSRTGKGGAINALSRRMGITPQAMADKAASLREAGIEPTVYDVVGETGQDMVGALARRPTAARQTMQDFSDAARVGLPGRVNRQAAAISPDGRTPDDAIAAVNTARNTAMEESMSPIRGTPVPLDSDHPAWQVLGTDEGRSAIRAAAGLERDPAVKKQILALGTTPKLPDGYKEIKAQHDAIDAMGLSPEATASAKAQLPPLPEVAQPTLTVDAADKIARSFKDAADNAAANGRAGRAKVLGDYGREIRGAAADAVPQYGDALAKYGDESRVSDAARLGESGLDRNTDEFVAKVAKLDTKPRVAPNTGPIQSPGDYIDRINGQGTNFMNSDEAADYFNQNSQAISDELARRTNGKMTADDLAAVAGTGAPERDLARLGFRRAIERKAGENVPRGALGVAEQLALAPEQRARTNALLGPEAGDTLSRNMAAEVDVARNRMRNGPRAGSPTNKNSQDQAFLENMASVVTHPLGWKATVATGLRALGKVGITDKAAGRIVDLATDATPGAVDNAIAMLTKGLNGNRKRATFIVNGIREAKSRQAQDPAVQ